MCDYPPGCCVNCSLPNTAMLCFEAFNSDLKIYSSTNVDNAQLSLLLSIHLVLLKKSSEFETPIFKNHNLCNRSFCFLVMYHY